VVTGMTSTGLSPEWDRWFDEAFTDLVASDAGLVQAEFDALIGASWRPPAASAGPPDDSPADDRPAGGSPAPDSSAAESRHTKGG
jgi:hypothetical protein